MFIFPLNKNNNNLFQDDFFIIPPKILIEPHYEMKIKYRSKYRITITTLERVFLYFGDFNHIFGT